MSPSYAKILIGLYVRVHGYIRVHTELTLTVHIKPSSQHLPEYYLFYSLSNYLSVVHPVLSPAKQTTKCQKTNQMTTSQYGSSDLMRKPRRKTRSVSDGAAITDFKTSQNEG